MPNNNSDFKYIWIVRNPHKSIVSIRGLMQSGAYFIRGETTVALHEQFSYSVLSECQDLRTAETKGLIITIEKKILTPGIVTTNDIGNDSNKELENIKSQVQELKELLTAPKTTSEDNLKIEIDELKQMLANKNVDSISLENNELKSQLEELRSLLINKQSSSQENEDIKRQINELKDLLSENGNGRPSIASVPNIDLLDMSRKIAEAVNLQVSERLSAMGISNNGGVNLEGYRELTGDDVMTNNLIKENKKIPEKATLEQKSSLKESIIEVNVDDNADLLSSL